MSNKKKTKKLYESVYSGPEFALGTQPSPIVKSIPRYIERGSVCDIGAGEGRNSIFLAQKGFVVTAVDNVQVAIDKIEKLAKDNNVGIKTLVRDIQEFDWPENQDVMVAVLVLHHLPRSKALQVIKDMQRATAPGGLNAIQVITKDSDFYRLGFGSDINAFYPILGELRDMYGDWEILEYKKQRGAPRKTHPDGSPMYNTSESMIARKPRAKI